MGGSGDFWRDIPFASKVILTLYTILFILFKFNVEEPFIYMVNAPYFVVKLQVWRMFTTQFIEWSGWNFLLGIWMIYSSASKYEKAIGTVAYIIDFFFQNFLIQLFHFIAIYILVFAKRLGEHGTMYPSMGLWNIGMLYMSLRCFSNPDEITYLPLLPIKIKNKYKPIALLIFYHLIWLSVFRVESLQYDFIGAVLLAYIEVKYFGGMFLRLSLFRIEYLKRSFIFNNWSKRYDFANANNGFHVMNYGPQQSQLQQSSSTISSFQGKGISIGGTLNIQSSESQTNQQQHIITPSIQSLQQSESQQDGDSSQFVEKSVSIEDGDNKQLSIQQQRELIFKRLQSQIKEQNSTNKSEIETNAESSITSSTVSIPMEYLIQQQKDGGTTLNEDLY